MTVLIKGIEMPITCCHCYLMDYNSEIKWEQSGRREQGGWICLLTKELIDNTKREEHCPLIEVPTPHGRLIDADKLFKLVKAEWNPYGKPTIEYEDGLRALKLIADARVIIEAEEEE